MHPGSRLLAHSGLAAESFVDAARCVLGIDSRRGLECIAKPFRPDAVNERLACAESVEMHEEESMGRVALGSKGTSEKVGTNDLSNRKILRRSSL